ncbi:trans-aconitate 2-methyltransferase [Alphaproteobacteria bacterium LSUCC0719]
MIGRLSALWPFSIEAGVIRAYTAALGRHGASPQGVFWNSAKSQNARFAALLAAIGQHRSRIGGDSLPAPVIADIGCGYGALLDYMSLRNTFADWGYVGCDINPAMIRACHQRFPDRRASFRLGSLPSRPVDYALFSGTFNLCMIDDAVRWQRYILDQLEICHPHCRHGMVLNLLGRRRMAISNHIFYADRQAILLQLRQRFGDVHVVDTPGLKHDMTLIISS